MPMSYNILFPTKRLKGVAPGGAPTTIINLQISQILWYKSRLIRSTDKCVA